MGESHDAAHALGYKVVRIRMLAILFGGAMAGLGGAYISLVRVPQWTDGITAGAGWIALAIVVFASWKPWRILIGAYLFGGITVLQLNLQAAGARIPVEYLSMSPYLITILVLVIMSSGKARGGAGRTCGSGPEFPCLTLGANTNRGRMAPTHGSTTMKRRTLLATAALGLWPGLWRQPPLRKTR